MYIRLGEWCIEGWGSGVFKAEERCIEGWRMVYSRLGSGVLKAGEWCIKGWGEAIVKGVQEICTYYGVEDRCASVDWQTTITVRNCAAENCPKLQGNECGHA